MKRYIKASMSDVDLSYDDIQKIEDGLYKIVKKYFSDGRYSHTARIAVTSFKYDSPQYTARPSSGYSNTSASPSMNANSAQLSEFKREVKAFLRPFGVTRIKYNVSRYKAHWGYLSGPDDFPMVQLNAIYFG